MTGDDDLHVQLGRVRSRRAPRARTFIAQALAAAERAGGTKRRSGRTERGGDFGRGRAASVAAVRRLGHRSRVVVIKSRVARFKGRLTALKAHLGYLRRDGVSQDGSAGRTFDAERDDADHLAFAERCDGDRHHFRFIVSPDDADRLSDLKAFTRELMQQAERDLGTKLDWVGIDHWNTEHPHVHVIMRGKADDGRDLVIGREYISAGLRARAEHLVTQELGPRSDLEIRRGLDAQVHADRWTRLDRVLAAEAARHGQIVDLRPGTEQPVEGHVRSVLIGRMRKLEYLGLAEPLGPVQWRLSEDAEPTLRSLGERTDIIKRIHQGLAEQRIERSMAQYALDENAARRLTGRLVARGLNEELQGTAFAVIDGVDGRVHHVCLPDLDAVSDANLGGIVELRQYEDVAGRARIGLAVRSDLPLAAQVNARGATWLDRQLVGRTPAELSAGGFGGEVRLAMEGRIDHLVGERLARRQGPRVVFARDLLETLRQRDLDTKAAEIGSSTGLRHYPVQEGDVVAGTYRRRLDLASGRFAMMDDGLGFSLVPWSPSLERHLGQELSGTVRAGRVEWSFARSRGLEIS